MVNIIVAPMKKLVLMRDVVALFSEMTRSCSDSDFSENTTITVLPGYLYVISGKYIKTRKSNPFHRFFNGLTPVCLQCFPAQNISPLENFTAFQLNNMHYYISC